jgi:hypothetical protein
MSKAAALVRTWLVIDFFGEARRAGHGHTSSLTTTIFTQSFFAFVFAALLYPDVPPVPFAAANLCLSSLLVAIGALGDESRPERRAADELLLRTSPLAPLEQALARAGHAAFALVLVAAGMALPPAILLAFVAHDASLAAAYVLGACACAALASGALGVLARACTHWFGAARTALLLGSLRALLLAGGVVLFALGLPHLRATKAAMPLGASAIELLPPYQVARWLAAPAADAWRWLPLLGAGTALLLAAAWLAAGTDGARTRPVRTGVLRRALARIAPGGATRALAEFTAIGMWRSAGFRARVLPLLGVPTAMVFLAMRGGTSERDFVLGCVVMQLPAIYLPFLVVFLPRADQPGTAWVFAHAPAVPAALVHDAVWRALVTHVLVPVFALAIALACALGARGLAMLPPAVFALACGVFAARGAARALRELPFTAAHEANAGPDLGAMFASALALGGLGAAFGLWLPRALHWPVAALALSLAAAAVVRARSPAAGPPLPDVDAAGPAPGAAEPASAPRDREGEATGKPTGLARELRAIAVLYAVLCVLPLLAGTIFAA